MTVSASNGPSTQFPAPVPQNKPELSKATTATNNLGKAVLVSKTPPTPEETAKRLEEIQARLVAAREAGAAPLRSSMPLSHFDARTQSFSDSSSDEYN